LEIGNVRWIDVRKNVGLIEPEHGPDIVFKPSEVRSRGPVKVGHAVIFESSLRAGRKVAGEVRSL
jgi:cold shock CspA family protein